jgi:hypothetical protein
VSLKGWEFSLVKFSALKNPLKKGDFTDQKQRIGRSLFSLLFSLYLFEKSENAKTNWYHWLKIRLERVKGIEPSSHRQHFLYRFDRIKPNKRPL